MRTVFIPAAGLGSRLESKTKYICKPLIGVDHRPLISRIIDLYPDSFEFVIALGYKGKLLKDFLNISYPKHKFKFVVVDKFDSVDGSLGYTLNQSKRYLQKPFIFHASDSLLTTSPILSIKQNWIGISLYNGPAKSEYRLIHKEQYKINEKGIGLNSSDFNVYIGVCGIYDFKEFWKNQSKLSDKEFRIGEVPVLNKINIKKKQLLEWFDGGNFIALEEANRFYSNKSQEKINILEKNNEAIWFLKSGNVVKFSDDKSFIKNRIKRASILKGYVPEIIDSKENFFSYQKIDGKVLSENINTKVFELLLKRSLRFWDPEKAKNRNYYDFYYYKSIERVELFYKNFKKNDSVTIINNEKLPKLSNILKKVDWEKISNGLATNFHGDFHFENILLDKNNNFIFLDWRQDFNGDIKKGDIYYDLGKLMHGLIINHGIIKNNLYFIDWRGNKIEFDFHRKSSLVECEKFFISWLENHNLDIYKVNVIAALIFLNISSLHHYPYSLLLYSLGKKMLFDLTKYK
jgi:choline kinase